MIQKRRKRFLYFLLFLSFWHLSSQNFLVEGTVEDNDGFPIMGANIIEQQNPLNGAVTDFDGVFKINVSENSALEISYVGYVTKTVQVNGSNIIFQLMCTS